MSGVTIEALDFAYGQTAVLKGLSLDVPEGAVCGVIGSSGSGKTTLLRCLLGLEVAARGRISVNDTDLVQADIESWRRKIGYVPQNSLLLPHMTAQQNVMLPLTVSHGKAAKEAALLADRRLAVLGLGELIDRRPWRLSGGQQQRVAIARALVIAPSVILMDEPTAALDFAASEIVAAAIRGEVTARNAVAIVVTHNLGFAKLACDSIALLADGAIRWHRPTPEVELEKAVMELI